MGTRQFRINRMIAYAMLILGLVSLVASAYFEHLILAFVGLGLTFWGALLLYITPSRHVSLELLNVMASSNLGNIERILTDANIVMAEIPPGQRVNAETLPQIRRAVMSHQIRAYAIRFPFGKGIYLSPKYLKDFESSLVFVPSTRQALPEPEEMREEKLYYGKIWPKGVFLTPPGLALSKLFEKQLGTSFTRTDLSYIQNNLPKLLIEDLEIAEDVDVKTESSTIMVEITNHIFNEICQETRKLQKVHEAIGCPLSSAIACALAKATGKPIVIENEEQSQDGRTTRIQYTILED